MSEAPELPAPNSEDRSGRPRPFSLNDRAAVAGLVAAALVVSAAVVLYPAKPRPVPTASGAPSAVSDADRRSGTLASWGTPITKNGVTVRYGSDVPVSDAQVVLEWLAADRLFEGRERAIGLRTEGGAFVLAIEFKVGLDRDELVVDRLRTLAGELSKRLGSRPVEIQMLDVSLRTTRFVAP